MLLIPRQRRLYAGTTPTPTFRGSLTIARQAGEINFNGNISSASVVLGDESEDRLVIAAIGRVPTVASLLRVTMNGEHAIVKQAIQANASVYIAYALVPSGGNLLTINGQFSASCGDDPRVTIWTVTGLASPTPVDVQSSVTATAVARTVNLFTEPGGFAVAVAGNDIIAAQSCAWTGDQSPTERVDTAVSSSAYSAADITTTSDDASNVITATFAASSSTGITLLAASWR